MVFLQMEKEMTLLDYHYMSLGLLLIAIGVVCFLLDLEKNK